MLNNTVPQILSKTNRIIGLEFPKCMSVATQEKARSNQQEYYQNLKNRSDKNEKDASKPERWDQALTFEEIPGPKPWPVIGNFWRFLPPFGEYSKIPTTDLFKRLHEKYGNVLILKGLGRPPNLTVADPEDIETVYRNDGPWPVRETIPSYVYYRKVHRKDYFKEPGIGATQGEEWFKFRSKINPILMQPRVVAAKVPEINETCQDFIRNVNLLLRKHEDGIMPDNFIVEIQKWTLESMGVLALDTRLGCLEPNLPADSPAYENIKRVNEFFELMYQLDIRPSLWRYISTPNWRRYVKVLDTLTRENMEYVNQALKKLESESNTKPENKRSALERMIQLDPKIATITALDLMIGGVDTTSITLSSALYLLSTNLDKQEILRKESRENLRNKDSPVTEQILEKSPYTKAAVKETLRIYSTAPGNIRTTTKDMVLGGYQVPKGTQVHMHNPIPCRDEKYFKNALEFIPERWLRTNTGEFSHKNAHPFAYLPFGHGPRTCIGKRMVSMELEIALLKIIRNFKISWPHKDEPNFEQKLFYGITSPLKLKFESAEN